MLTIAFRPVQFRCRRRQRRRGRSTQRSQVQVHHSTGHARRVRGRDRHASAVHGRHGARPRAIIVAAAFTLPALGFALGPLFSRVPFEWQPIGVAVGLPQRHLRHEGGHDRAGDRRGRQVDRLRARAQSRDRHRAGGPVQPVHRAVLAVHAPRLPGPLTRRRRALHLPLPRRRLRLPRDRRRRAARASARPLLHAR